MNFRSFLEYSQKINNMFSQNTIGKHNDKATAAFLPTTFTGSEDLGVMGHGLPSTDILIPTVTRESEILSIFNATASKNNKKRKNDKSQKDIIKINLKDGTSIFLTIFQYNKIKSKKKLEPGEKIRVTFRRNPHDKGSDPSNIIDIS